MSKCIIIYYSQKYFRIESDKKKKRKSVMMGQFLGRSLKKCLHFFPLFELGFLYTTTTYFQKMSSIRKLAIQLYYVLYTTLCCTQKIQIIQLCFSIFGFSLNTDGVFYIYLYLQQTLLKVHFFYLEKSHCTILYTTDGTAKL